MRESSEQEMTVCTVGRAQNMNHTPYIYNFVFGLHLAFKPSLSPFSIVQQKSAIILISISTLDTFSPLSL
jgi:hypothetical protein